MEVCFLSMLQVEEINDNEWQLLTAFQASVTEGKDVRLVTVPSGFKTDFASVPRLPFAYWLFGNIGHRPAVLHDYLYFIGGTTKDKIFADNVLRHGIMADGESWVKASAMWTAVRLFGSRYFVKENTGS